MKKWSISKTFVFCPFHSKTKFRIVECAVYTQIYSVGVNDPRDAKVWDISKLKELNKTYMDINIGTLHSSTLSIFYIINVLHKSK